jgi:hypothetical protein
LDNKKHNLFTDGLYLYFLNNFKTTMQNLLSETINIAGQTNNNTVITALCAHVLNTHNTTTWPEAHAAATNVFLSRLNFPALPTAALTPVTLASFVEDVARVMPEPEDDSAIDLVQRHRDEEEDEEDDSGVVSDDVIEFDGSESSSSSSFEPEKKTRRRR